jgi:hypothetical protein
MREQGLENTQYYIDFMRETSEMQEYYEDAKLLADSYVET